MIVKSTEHALQRAYRVLASLGLLGLIPTVGLGIAFSAVGGSELPQTIVNTCLAMMGIALQATQRHLSVPSLTGLVGVLFGGSFLWAALHTSVSLVNTRRLLHRTSGYALGRSAKLDAALARPDLRRLALRLLPSPRPLALTAGLWRPQVILSEGIVSSLSEEELRSVLLHEQAHVRSRDPVRLAVAQFLKDVLWFLPVARSLARDFVDAIEEGADDQAVMLTQQPVDLASALVKTAKAGLISTSPVASSLAGNLSVEDRVKRLLGMEVERRADTTPTRWLTSGLIVMILLVVVMLPVAGREASVEKAMEEAMIQMPMMTCSTPLRYGR